MKTILITGSTDGIGKLVAIQLAKEGHAVFLHGRNPEKLNAVINEVKQASSNKKVEGFVADFSDLSAISAMGQDVNEKLSNLDVLINNAGVFKLQSEKTVNGLDIRFVVNYLAPYALTNSLLPLFKKSNTPRIINLSSAAQAPVSLEALAGRENIGMQAAYAQSKLALTMWSFELAKNWPFATVIAVNPGSLLNTKMANEVYGQHWSPATKGSDILYDLAVSEEYKNSTGKYFDNDKGELKGAFAEAHSDAYRAKKIDELTTQTNKVLNK
ncbi:SDR family NAD(P)-dependent oxidoreductase [Roseivirga misakiensis]|uniref:Short-chain dehydrogenase n=1 Tax=Roseivirga misakiensis TaxID=1563681 RepID=A0A1E5SLA3_9BACT|nr:SDR family NAD(P)-dependent oxidoreductase [Roseivirga misakiensis]OEJ99908.1 short-chain dehydrogenase [Roseivirga misakiensis]